MAKIKGVCHNFDNCDMAADKVVQEAEKTHFVCEECGKPLYPVTAETLPWWKRHKRLLICIGLVLGIAAVAGGIVYGVVSAGERVAEPPIVDPKPVPEPQPDPLPAPTHSLSYGKWSGEWKGGKPHGMGTMTYTKSHLIDTRDQQKRTAQAGDYIIGEFYEGKLVQGRWYDASNNIKGSIIIGR